jgi:hypothetical protein
MDNYNLMIITDSSNNNINITIIINYQLVL